MHEGPTENRLGDLGSPVYKYYYYYYYKFAFSDLCSTVESGGDGRR